MADRTGPTKIAAVATRVRSDERDAIEALPAEFGANVADKLRVLIRYSMEHVDEVGGWLRRTNGQPADTD